MRINSKGPALIIVIVLLAAIALLVSGCAHRTNVLANQTSNQTQPSKNSDVELQEFDPEKIGNPHPKIKQVIPPCCSHPYWHSIYRAFSIDGITWQQEGELLKEHASVPAIVQRDDGIFILYYVDGETDTLECSISSDGKDFEQGNCIIYGFTEQKAWDPYVMKLENGIYRMFFFSPGIGDNRILSAISKDGIKWQQEKGIRFQQAAVYDPAVIKIGTTWKMYLGQAVERGNILVARSDDGENFELEKEFDFDGSVPEVTQLEKDNYALYFCNKGIQVVTSSNGLEWKDRKTAVAQPASKIFCDPSVIKVDDQFIMYYKEV